MIIISIIFMSTLLSYCIYAGKSVAYEELTIESAPEVIREEVQGNEDHIGFQIIHYGTHTYIYYRSNDVPNDYITTEVEVRSKFGKLFVTAIVTNAVNDGYVNDYKIIKLDKTSSDKIILNENNQTN